MNTKEDILKNVVNQLLQPLTFIVLKNILWKSMGTKNSLVTNIHQNIFCVQQKNAGLEQLKRD